MFCTHSVRYRNIANIEAERTNAAIDAPPNDGLRNSVRSSIGCVTRRSTTTKATSSAAAATRQAMIAPFQSSALPRISPNTSRNSAAENVKVPVQSAAPACGSLDSSTRWSVRKIAYASTTHCRSSNDEPRSRSMYGSATFTTVMSSRSMNVAMQTATRVHHLAMPPRYASRSADRHPAARGYSADAVTPPVPESLWARLRAEPVRAPEHIALAAADLHAPAAAAWAAEKRSRYAVSPAELAQMA